jgi:hypothetical protein
MLAAFLFLLYFYRYFPKNVDIRDARTLICPCEGTVLDIVDKDGYYYCRECGCPQVKFWPDSELRKKVTFQHAKCPKHKW